MAEKVLRSELSDSEKQKELVNRALKETITNEALKSNNKICQIVYRYFFRAKLFRKII